MITTANWNFLEEKKFPHSTAYTLIGKKNSSTYYNVLVERTIITAILRVPANTEIPVITHLRRISQEESLSAREPSTAARNLDRG